MRHERNKKSDHDNDKTRRTRRAVMAHGSSLLTNPGCGSVHLRERPKLVRKRRRRRGPAQPVAL